MELCSDVYLNVSVEFFVWRFSVEVRIADCEIFLHSTLVEGEK